VSPKHNAYTTTRKKPVVAKRTNNVKFRPLDVATSTRLIRLFSAASSLAPSCSAAMRISGRAIISAKTPMVRRRLNCRRSSTDNRSVRSGR
jgi:hypothetical protein